MNAIPKPSPPRHASYDEIASEYYDPRRHPTCASLRELSAAYLTPRIELASGAAKRLVEVGVGQSLLAPSWRAAGGDLGYVTLLDNSPSMLAYSADWQRLGTRLVLADAAATGLPAASVDVLISSLGDPYNSPLFWQEVSRILKPGGICHFTLPAFEWAMAFRDKENMSTAEFLRADGVKLLLPSPVLNELDQRRMFATAGLRLVDEEALTRQALTSRPAPKLMCVPVDVPAVRGYSLQRP
ncbi:class I SAM-dependent methyltransferase [Mesorhizobium abyssinicae]|uniref:class I SAM-dependent methyltransferase n=1 Tax=Mesorhizobium abyssinicae TaxID=1209958 RepID=UPI00339B4799